MDPVAPYVEATASQSMDDFVKQHDGFFLLKRPAARPSTVKSKGPIAFVTSFSRLDADPFATEWRITPIRMRPENPYPDRITIGRAPNCDVVLRVHFVSKTHAILLRQPDGSFLLQDSHATASTFLNGRRVLPSEAPREVAIGDEIALGALCFEFVDGARLYKILRREYV